LLDVLARPRRKMLRRGKHRNRCRDERFVDQLEPLPELDAAADRLPHGPSSGRKRTERELRYARTMVHMSWSRRWFHTAIANIANALGNRRAPLVSARRSSARGEPRRRTARRSPDRARARLHAG